MQKLTTKNSCFLLLHVCTHWPVGLKSGHVCSFIVSFFILFLYFTVLYQWMLYVLYVRVCILENKGCLPCQLACDLSGFSLKFPLLSVEWLSMRTQAPSLKSLPLLSQEV